MKSMSVLIAISDEDLEERVASRTSTHLHQCHRVSPFLIHRQGARLREILVEGCEAPVILICDGSNLPEVEALEDHELGNLPIVFLVSPSDHREVHPHRQYIQDPRLLEAALDNVIAQVEFPESAEETWA